MYYISNSEFSFAFSELRDIKNPSGKYPPVSPWKGTADGERTGAGGIGSRPWGRIMQILFLVCRIPRTIGRKGRFRGRPPASPAARRSAVTPASFRVHVVPRPPSSGCMPFRGRPPAGLSFFIYNRGMLVSKNRLRPRVPGQVPASAIFFIEYTSYLCAFR